MIVHSRIEGSGLAGNLLQDPSDGDLFVYLPPGYEGSEDRYPALTCSRLRRERRALVQPPADGRRWAPPIEDVLDPVFARIGTAPLIVVIPDGWTRYGHGQWVDSPVGGNFKQYVLHDVVAHVDGTYRTIGSSAVAASSGSRREVSGLGTSPRESGHLWGHGDAVGRLVLRHDAQDVPL